ncbi:MAG: serine/threonine protein kinase [Pirellulaceae bacterium]
MNQPPPHNNPNDPNSNIYITSTDYDLAEGHSNDYRKYCNFHAMDGGGNGVLYSCYDINLGRNVAIKRLPDQKKDDPIEKRRLLREARITAQLQHPNTVPVYEVGRDDEGRIYFSMKKIEGENLFRILGRIARNDAVAVKEFTLDRLLGILIQAGNALSYAHAHGVIHRDIKPENIMIGMYGEVMLMDWGVAKVWGRPNEGGDDLDYSRDELVVRLTGTGQRPGTPLYMSPEQVLEHRQIDERTDIFSMGVVLYELLALQEPFRGRTIRETFDNIIHKTPRPPSEVSAERNVPKQLDAIVLKAIEKKPLERYQNIRLMINDIRNFRDQAMHKVHSE